MWHCDWSQDGKDWYCVFINDCSRKMMTTGKFPNATEENTTFLLYQAMLSNETSPIVVLSDKGSQFYANKKNNKGQRGISKFEQELKELNIEFWTSRRNHPQTNGKLEKKHLYTTKVRTNSGLIQIFIPFFWVVLLLSRQ